MTYITNMEAAGIINECWRSIDGYANYQVSNIGRVRNTKTGAVLQGGVTADGYQSVLLSNKGRMQKCLTHRLVAGEFVENPDDKQHVKHVDGDKTNTCFNNLRWISNSEHTTGTGKRRSRYWGVSWNDTKQKWSANITNNNQHYHLGCFDNEKHAARVYNINAVDMFGEYAKLNDVSDDEQDEQFQ